MSTARIFKSKARLRSVTAGKEERKMVDEMGEGGGRGVDKENAIALALEVRRTMVKDHQKVARNQL